MTSVHSDMRAVLTEAFRRCFLREPNRTEIQCLQAIAWLESRYGRGWKPPGNGSYNLGAIQAGSTWKGDVFEYTDTRPNADGTSTPYVTAFRKYRTLLDGAMDLCLVVYRNRARDRMVLPHATKGDTLAFSRGLHSTVYYEGFGKTVADRIANHHRAVMGAIVLQCRELGEPMPDGSTVEPPKPVLRRGMKGEPVKELQRLLNEAGQHPPLPVDGDFGPGTMGAVVGYQQTHKLVSDGVVGAKTWESLSRG